MAVAFSPDSKKVLTGSDDNTLRRLWETATGKLNSGPPLQHQDKVGAVAFSPDGKTVLTGSTDTTAPTLGRQQRVRSAVVPYTIKKLD